MTAILTPGTQYVCIRSESGLGRARPAWLDRCGLRPISTCFVFSLRVSGVHMIAPCRLIVVRAFPARSLFYILVTGITNTARTVCPLCFMRDFLPDRLLHLGGRLVRLGCQPAAAHRRADHNRRADQHGVLD